MISIVKLLGEFRSGHVHKQRVCTRACVCVAHQDYSSYCTGTITQATTPEKLETINLLGVISERERGLAAQLDPL
jgi:hypothetical protein